MIQNLVTQGSTSARMILHAERRHQYTVLQNGRVNLFWIIAAVALLLPAVAAAFGLFTAALIVSIEPSLAVRAFEMGAYNGTTRGLILHMLGMALATDVVVALVALALAANAITREYAGGTWSLLLLTGVSARHLVLTKWWASVLVLRRDFFSVAVMRVGVVSLLYLYPPVVLHMGPAGNLLVYGLAVALTLFFTVLDAQIIAALAVLGALFTEQANTGLSFGLRLVALVMAAAVVVWAVLLTETAWLFLTIPAALVIAWAVLLALSLWAALVVGVRARILPVHDMVEAAN